MRPAGMPRGSGVSLSLDAPLGRRTNPPRPNTAVRNFAMDTVQANVLQPLLEDMFIAQPADPVAVRAHPFAGGYVAPPRLARARYLTRRACAVHVRISWRRECRRSHAYEPPSCGTGGRQRHDTQTGGNGAPHFYSAGAQISPSRRHPMMCSWASMRRPIQLRTPPFPM